jgi:hypothetical protein
MKSRIEKKKNSQIFKLRILIISQIFNNYYIQNKNQIFFIHLSELKYKKFNYYKLFSVRCYR